MSANQFKSLRWLGRLGSKMASSDKTDQSAGPSTLAFGIEAPGTPMQQTQLSEF